MKAAIYIRVSTDKQEAENQMLQLKEYCERAGYDIYKSYVDIISGKEQSRPEYNQLFEDAYKKHFQVLVFWDLSRFSRAGAMHTLNKLNELESVGVSWESYQEPYFRSAGEFKDVLLSVMATLAKIEREKISERTKAGLARVKRAGKTLGRPKGSKDKKRRKKKGYYLRYEK